VCTLRGCATAGTPGITAGLATVVEQVVVKSRPSVEPLNHEFLAVMIETGEFDSAPARLALIVHRWVLHLGLAVAQAGA